MRARLWLTRRAEAEPVAQETVHGVAAEIEGSIPAGVPLCVDLDGTLVKSDTLLDTVVVPTRKHPGALLSFPGWVARGKAAFKRKVTELAQIDVVHLPY